MPPKNKTEDSKESLDMAVQTAIAALNKKFNGSVQNLGTVSPVPKFDKQIPTGSVALDIAIGGFRKLESGVWQTGIPPSRMIEVFAANAVGKTTLMGHMIGNAQKLYPDMRCAVIDMENALDPAYWAKLGVDWSMCDFVQPAHGEEAFEIMETMIKTRAYSVIAFDSIGAILAETVAKEDMGKSHMAVDARLITQAVKKLTPELTRPGVSTSIFFSNQVRTNMASSFGGVKTPGGNAYHHAMSLRIKLSKDYINGKTFKIIEEDEQVGHFITAEVVKNKIAPSCKKGIIPLVYTHGFDNHGTLFDMAVERGIIVQSGAWFSMNGEQMGQGRAKSLAKVKEDNALSYYLYDKILTLEMQKRGLHPNGDPIEGQEQRTSSKKSISEEFQVCDVSQYEVQSNV